MYSPEKIRRAAGEIIAAVGKRRGFPDGTECFLIFARPRRRSPVSQKHSSRKIS